MEICHLIAALFPFWITDHPLISSVNVVVFFLKKVNMKSNKSKSYQIIIITVTKLMTGYYNKFIWDNIILFFSFNSQINIKFKRNFSSGIIIIFLYKKKIMFYIEIIISTK